MVCYFELNLFTQICFQTHKVSFNYSDFFYEICKSRFCNSYFVPSKLTTQRKKCEQIKLNWHSAHICIFYFFWTSAQGWKIGVYIYSKLWWWKKNDSSTIMSKLYSPVQSSNVSTTKNNKRGENWFSFLNFYNYSQRLFNP